MRRRTVLGAFLLRDVLTARSYRLGFGLDLTATVVNVGMSFFLGHLVDRHAAHEPALSQGYFSFAVIGIVMAGMLQVGIVLPAATITTEQTAGTFEMLLTAPISSSLLIVATSTFSVVRAAVFALVELMAAAVIFGFHVHATTLSFCSAAIAFVGVSLFAFALGTGVAAVASVFKRVVGLVGLLGLGLTLLGGVYYPLDALPNLVHRLALASPFTLALQVARSGLLSAQPDVARLALFLAEVATLVPLSIWLFGWALDRGRDTGALSHY